MLQELQETVRLFGHFARTMNAAVSCVPFQLTVCIYGEVRYPRRDAVCTSSYLKYPDRRSQLKRHFHSGQPSFFCSAVTDAAPVPNVSIPSNPT